MHVQGSMVVQGGVAVSDERSTPCAVAKKRDLPRYVTIALLLFPEGRSTIDMAASQTEWLSKHVNQRYHFAILGVGFVLCEAKIANSALNIVQSGALISR